MLQHNISPGAWAGALQRIAISQAKAGACMAGHMLAHLPQRRVARGSSKHPLQHLWIPAA